MPGILFDVDGTLIDTNYLHVLAWSRAFRDHDLDFPMSAIHALVGMGSDKLLEQLTGGQNERIDRAHSEHYDRLRGEMRAFEGAGDLLRDCHERGATVVLATSAKGEEVDPILDTLGVHDAVDAVVSSADAEHSKPDPDIVLVALRRAGLRPTEAIFVGDTVWDVEAARRARLGCVCVTTGGIAREVLAQSGALAVYESISQLRAELARSPLAGYLPPERARL